MATGQNWFQNLWGLIHRLVTGQDRFDPRARGNTGIPEQWSSDEVAQITGWGPNKKGGNDHNFYRFNQVSDQRVEYRGTGCLRWLVGCLLPAIGLVVLSMGAAACVAGAAAGERWQTLGLGALLVVVGLALVIGAILGFLHSRNPLVVDTAAGFVWRGNKPILPQGIAVEGAEGNRVPLSQVHAVQVIKEFVLQSRKQTDREAEYDRDQLARSGTGSLLGGLLTTGGEDDGDYDTGYRETVDTSFYSYELNLVLKSGDRITITDHSDQGDILREAGIIANMLGVELWDNSNPEG